jgi:uncharacterized protein (TIGR02099 family)
LAICRWSWYLTVASVVAAALVVTVLRVWLPSLSSEKDRIEAFLSEHAPRPVKIEQLEAYWEEFHPRLRAQGLSMLSEDGTRTGVRLDEVRLRVAWLPLLTGDLVFDELTVVRPVVSGARLTDGSIVLADIVTASADTERADGRALVRWLLRQNDIRIEDGEFVWSDLRSDSPPVRVTGINLNLRNDGERHRFGGSAKLPYDITREVSFAADIRSAGIPYVESGWDGSIYVHAVDLNVARLPDIVREQLPPRLDGELNVQVWTEWNGNALRKADGFVRVRGLSLALPRMRVPFEASTLEGELAWNRSESGWRLELSNLLLAFEDRPWPVGSLVAERDLVTETLRIEAGRIRADEIVRLVGELESSAKTVELIKDLQPGGEARDVKLTVSGPWAEPRGYSLQGRIADGAVLPYERVPGLTGVGGDLTITQDGGEFVLDTAGATARFPYLSDSIIELDHAAGHISWFNDDDRLRVIARGLKVSNADASATGELELVRPADPVLSPHLRVEAQFGQGNGERLLEYYPRVRWPEGAYPWLRAANPTGRVTGGRLYYDGLVRRFPFRDGGGVFEVVVDVEEAALSFARNWPRITDARGSLRFDRASLDVVAEGGRIHGLDIGHAEVHVDNLRDPEKIARIQGRAYGPFAEAVEFLRSGPVLGDARGALEGMSAAGNGALQLSVEVPLRDRDSTTVNGQYTFEGASLKVAESVEFTGIGGTLDFTERAFRSEGLQARVFDGPVDLTVSTPRPGRRPEVEIQGTGRAPVGAFTDILGPGLIGPLEGQAGWTGRLALGPGGTSLRVESDLRGLTSAFPPPLRKEADDTLALTLDEEYGRDGRIATRFTAGESLRGVMRYARGKTQRVLQAGHIVLGRGEAQLPKDGGMVFSARLDSIDLDSWLEHYRDAPQSESELPDDLKQAEAEIRSARLFDREFRDARVTLRRDGQFGWRGPLIAQEAAGSVDIDWQPGARAIALDLQRLRWPKPEATRPGRVSAPAEMPALRVRSAQFTYNDMPLGSLELDAALAGGAYEVQRFVTRAPHLRVQGGGRWYDGPEGQRTQIDVGVDSDDTGAALAALGYPGQMEGGRTDLKVRLEWPGDPAAAGIDNLDGEFYVNAVDGEFLNIDPGAGRLFGLFNMNVIARRLTLDFSDIFAKGYEYDEIRGRIDIADGSAYTRDLQLKGPAAEIRVTGRSGLVALDHDMRITVAPQVGGNLALATGAYAGPAAGAIVYVLQKLLKRQLADMVKYRYSVTGPWADPIIDRVGATEVAG